MAEEKPRKGQCSYHHMTALTADDDPAESPQRQWHEHQGEELGIVTLDEAFPQAVGHIYIGSSSQKPGSSSPGIPYQKVHSQPIGKESTADQGLQGTLEAEAQAMEGDYYIVGQGRGEIEQGDAIPDTHELKELLGAVGVVLTPLRPVGMCDFAGRRLECVAESGYVDKGNKVKVIDVESTQLTVRTVDES